MLEKILARNTELIINVSNYEYESACAFKLPAEKMVTICNGVRAAVERSNLMLPLDQDCINLLFVGRFDRQKGLDILLRFFARQQFEHIKLYLLGERVLDDQGLCIPPGVVNLGWVDNREIDSYYRLFDAVIMPSRWEGFGLAAIEAMRNRKAVIASSRGALPEIVSHGVNGYLFDLDDEDQLLTLLGQLSKTMLMDMGRKGYQIYKEKFSSLAMNEQVWEQYSRLAVIIKAYANSPK